MKLAWSAVGLVLLAVSLGACGPSFWTDVEYLDGRNQLLRPLPDFLVGRSKIWVIDHLGVPDEERGHSRQTLVYRDRDFDLGSMLFGETAQGDSSPGSSYIEGTRFVRDITLVLFDEHVTAVTGVVYLSEQDALIESLAQILLGQDKSWIIGQLGPPDVILPRMGGDTLVYRNRSLDLWVLRIRTTITNSQAVYTHAEGNTFVRRLNVYFDTEGVVRDVSFPQGNSF